jgi:hypothetical protein
LGFRTAKISHNLDRNLRLIRDVTDERTQRNRLHECDLDRTRLKYVSVVRCGNNCYVVHIFVKFMKVFLENLTVAELVKKFLFFFRSVYKIP